MFEKLRKLIKTEHNNDKAHLMVKEMETIVELITGNKSKCKSAKRYFKENLSDYGWEDQRTVDTHPVYDNLLFLLNSILSSQQKKIRQDSLVRKVVSENIKSSKSNSFDWENVLKGVISTGKAESVTIEKDIVTIFLK